MSNNHSVLIVEKFYQKLTKPSNIFCHLNNKQENLELFERKLNFHDKEPHPFATTNN